MDDCDLNDKKRWTPITLKKGTIVYNGTQLPSSFSYKQFWAFHPIGKQIFKKYPNIDEKQLYEVAKKFDPFIIFVSTNYDTAYGYANSCTKNTSGIINKYVLKKDVKLLRDLEMVGEETDYIADCICHKSKYNGYAIIYDKKITNLLSVTQKMPSNMLVPNHVINIGGKQPHFIKNQEEHLYIDSFILSYLP